MKFLFLVAAGACDGLTGLLLMVVPGVALRLMHISTVPAEPVYLRWVGAFVFSVGLSYFLPFVWRVRHCVAFTLVYTAWIRLVIGTFVMVAVIQSALPPGWLLVTATDYVIAAIQLAMLKSGAFADEV